VTTPDHLGTSESGDQYTDDMPRAVHVILVVFLFAALGPPLGWATLLTIGFAAWGGPPGKILELLVIGSMMSYFSGLAPAVLAGLLTGFGQVFLRAFGFFHALAIGLAVGLLVIWKPSLLQASRMPFTQNPGDPVEFNRAALVVVLMCAVPTLICWFIGPKGQSKRRQIEQP